MAKTLTAEGKLNWETKAAMGITAVALAACGYLGLREALEPEDGSGGEINKPSIGLITRDIPDLDPVLSQQLETVSRISGRPDCRPQIITVSDGTNAEVAGICQVGSGETTGTFMVTRKAAGGDQQVINEQLLGYPQRDEKGEIQAIVLAYEDGSPDDGVKPLMWVYPDGLEYVFGNNMRVRFGPEEAENLGVSFADWLARAVGPEIAEAGEEETATATLTPTPSPSSTWTPTPTPTATVELTPTPTATLKEVEPKSVCGNSPLRPLTGFLEKEDYPGFFELARVRFCLVGEPKIVTETIVPASGTEVQAQTVVAEVRIFATDGSGGYRDYLIGLRDKVESGETLYIAFIQGSHYYPMTTDMTKVRDYLSQVLQVKWSRQISLGVFISSDESNHIKAVSEPDKEFALALMDALKNNKPLPEQPEGVYIRGRTIEFPAGVQIDE